VERTDLQLLWQYSRGANAQLLAAACRLRPFVSRSPRATARSSPRSPLGRPPGELDCTVFTEQPTDG
jgi:hypothetical protein